MTNIVPVNGHKIHGNDEHLSARDIEVLITALRLYYGDLVDIHAGYLDRRHVRELCKRIAEPGKSLLIVEGD